MSLTTASPAALAYLGDAVCELCVRELLVGVGLTSSARLNHFALDFANRGVKGKTRFIGYFRAFALPQVNGKVFPSLS